ncbi:MAG: o-succinylbenzoate synthase [Candidatus Zixiibacteriota bacterium]|nr:MAG: o-succinylbenzoate synthase [candidate division Zixibacteria bacterium]
MKIKDIRLFRYNLPLARPLVAGRHSISNRQGLILKCVRNDGNKGTGEIAPLPGLSNESLEEALEQVRTLIPSIPGHDLPETRLGIGGLLDDLMTDTDTCPSVRFGLETVLLNLAAAATKMSLTQLLGGKPTPSLPINALLTGSPKQLVKEAESAYRNGYRVLKIKIGRASMDENLASVTQVRDVCGSGTTLRLDANRAFALEQAVSFADRLGGRNIEYIEEPCPSLDENLIFAEKSDIPVALDESIVEAPEKVAENINRVGALILKPTLLGGVERTLALARQAREARVTTVTSSSFESSIGIMSLAQLAIAINPDTPAGLDTLRWFDRDVTTTPLNVTGGRLTLPDQNDLPLDYSALEEVPLD